MAKKNDSKLAISKSDKGLLRKRAGALKKLTDFLSNTIEFAEKKGNFIDALNEAVPWANDFLLEPLSEALPPLKFLTKVMEKIAEVSDPNELGEIACTLAFQKAVQLTVGSHSGPEGALKKINAGLSQMQDNEELDFLKFSLDQPGSHEFTRLALLNTGIAVGIAGYSPAQTDALVEEIDETFPLCLDKLLRHPDTSTKFAPWTKFVQSSASGRYRSRQALKEHQLFQTWLFEKSPLLGKSPFPLSEIYLKPECSDYRWCDLKARGGQKINPFLVPENERKDLEERVWHYLLDPNVTTPIVIQGIAGTGKSSFTLRLCRELRREFFKPIRIRLRKVQLDQYADFEKALEAAVEITSEEFSPTSSPEVPENLFQNGAIFREASSRHNQICRHVLILDGWDEINIANSTYQQRVADLLRFLQQKYLGKWSPRVRVILTGRPSTDVTASDVLDSQTPILTIQPLKPEHVRGYVHKIAELVNAYHKENAAAATVSEMWPSFDPTRFDDILDTYESDYELEQHGLSSGRQVSVDGTEQVGGNATAVLGLPLLTHLIVRLIAEWQTVEADDLVVNPARLYRNLINLTCNKSGQPEDSSVRVHELVDVVHYRGEKLRRLLQQTATAMSVAGKDAISSQELAYRLGWTVGQLDREASKAVVSRPLAALMISYYFKGGFNHLGCEFIHKSFREYLFAEAIIEELKTYGQIASKKIALVTRPLQTATDFFPNDPRHELSRQLALILGANWLSEEVCLYLADIVVWEIQRSVGNPQEEAGLPTEPISLVEWKLVRDALAALWYWWVEGVHLRATKPNPSSPNTTEPVAIEVSRLVPSPEEKEMPLRSTAEIDSCLGAGIFRLCSLVHSYIASAEGWLNPRPGKKFLEASDLWGEEGEERLTLSPYQIERKLEDGYITLFAPSGNNPSNFGHVAARINGTPGRPQGYFPRKESLSSVDFRGVGLCGLYFDEAYLGHARLDGVEAQLTSFKKVEFDQSSIVNATFNNSVFTNASFDRAQFEKTNVQDCDFSLGRLNRTIFKDCEVGIINFGGARISGSVFENIDLSRANFRQTQILDADFRQTQGLRREQFDQAVLNKNVILPDPLPSVASQENQFPLTDQITDPSIAEHLLRQILNEG